VSDYTKINLEEVEDQAPKFGFAPKLEARFAGGDLGLERSGLSYQGRRSAGTSENDTMSTRSSFMVE